MAEGDARRTRTGFRHEQSGGYPDSNEVDHGCSSGSSESPPKRTRHPESQGDRAQGHLRGCIHDRDRSGVLGGVRRRDSLAKNRVITMETTVLTALVPAAAALGGALGNQWIAAKTGLKTRRLELYFQAKASGYRTLLERMGEFGCSPLDQAKYLTFLAAYETALVFASDEVAELLSGPSGISVNAQRLRAASTEEKR